MSLWNKVLALLDRLDAPTTAYAHCDVPCGIYDPHGAQVAADTVIAMVTKMQALQAPAAGADIKTRQTYENTVTRMITTKEQHAEILKHEVTVLWGDYFKPPHVQMFPNLHEHVWNTLKLASKCKQEVNLEAAQELKQAVDQIAEWFAESKRA